MATDKAPKGSSARSAHTMTPDQIVEEINDLREAMTISARRLYDLSQALHTHTRRRSSTETTPAYLAYSNAWIRFAGAVTQALRRTVTTDRVLDRYKKAEEERRLKDQEKQAAEAKRREDRQSQKFERKANRAVFGDLIELYGEEMVRDASQ